MLARPTEQDFAPFQKKYIDLVPDDVMLTLSEQKDSFPEFIETLSEELLDHRYQQGKWSIREVIAHIIDTEVIFNYRTLSIARGDTQTLLGFDQDVYINNGDFSLMNKEYLINYFNITRYATLIQYKSFADHIWEKRGKMSGYEMKLSAMPFMNAGHLLHHLNVINERYITY